MGAAGHKKAYYCKQDKNAWEIHLQFNRFSYVSTTELKLDTTASNLSKFRYIISKLFGLVLMIIIYRFRKMNMSAFIVCFSNLR